MRTMGAVRRREEFVLALREEGWTFRRIGEAIGVSTNMASVIWHTAKSREVADYLERSH